MEPESLLQCYKSPTAFYILNGRI